MRHGRGADLTKIDRARCPMGFAPNVGDRVTDEQGVVRVVTHVHLTDDPQEFLVALDPVADTP